MLIIGQNTSLGAKNMSYDADNKNKIIIFGGFK